MAEGDKAKKVKTTARPEGKDKRDEARRREAIELGACVSVRFTVKHAEELAKLADKDKRSIAHVVREAALAKLGLA